MSKIVKSKIVEIRHGYACGYVYYLTLDCGHKARRTMSHMPRGNNIKCPECEGGKRY